MGILTFFIIILIVLKIVEQGKKKIIKNSDGENDAELNAGRLIGEGMPMGEGMPLENPSPVKSLEIKTFVPAQTEKNQKPAAQARPLSVREEKAAPVPPLLQMAEEKPKQPENKEFVHSFASRPQTIAMAAEDLAKRQEKIVSDKEQDEEAERRRQDLVRGVIVSEILSRPNRGNRFQRRM